ncbi:MAG: BNR-repeat neuraminidase N-terminal domain-containing protein, partial [Bacteroidales bacterium]
VPQSMVLASVVPVQYTNGSIAAGDIMQPILYFNIITENTEPILTASKFSFSTAGTFAKIGKATLYSTGKSPAFSTVNKVGEVNITADNYEITTSVSPTFTEGDNYFWLAYDINDNASNGDKIDAAITGVLLSDGEHLVANGNPDGDRTVKNEYISVPGTFNKTINGEWGYSYICSSGYESLDHSVTFIPKSSDKIVELTFSNFNLYFPVSSIPVFKIYSGTNTTDNNKLLWKATSVNKIPEMNSHICPLEGDAALTVVYNSNGISSSSSYGWTATVKEFLSVPMVFESADAFQASTNILKPGAKNQEIIGFKVVTAGDKSPLTLNEVLLNLKGSHDKVRRVYLYTSGKNNVFSAANSIAEGIPSVDNESLNLVLSAPLKLLEGESYYWIAYDMGESIAAEQSIDAALTSLKIGIETKIPVLGDPEGVRVTKNTLDLQSGDNGTIMVGDEPLMFYDNGGVDGKSPKNFDGTITFAPKSQGKVIKLIFKKWSIGGNDNMYIYYGGEKKSKEDIKCTSSKNTETIVSMSEDGKLTINFKSPTYSVNTDGWEIEVSSYTLAELSLGKIGVTAVNPLSLLKGMTDAPMLRVDVEVKGDKGTLDITRMVFDAAATIGAAAKSANLYCTDTISNFIADKKFAESVNTAPYIFNGNYRATLPGVYRFWLTYDITPIAKEFDEVKAKFVTLTTNGKENTSATSPLASAVIKKGFNGIYTIGGSDAADYHTVAAAVAAMKDGIDGAVTFEMESGLYNELVTIPQIEGASALNTITLKSKTGRYHDVIIYSNQYIEPSYSDEKMFNEYGVFTVAGADYLTLDGVTITTTDMTFPSVVHIKNVSRNVTVKNCRIYTEMATTYTNDINLVYMYARDKANQNNDYF